MAKGRLLGMGAAAALAAALALGPQQARALGPLTFFFVGQAMQTLSNQAFGALSPSAPTGTPSWDATIGAAELLNDKLPVESADGFSFISARAPAPAALEIKAVSAEPLAQEALDKAWGPGLTDLFCGSTDSLWSRWIAIGGSVGLEVAGPDGAIIRRYGITKADCAVLAAR